MRMHYQVQKVCASCLLFVHVLVSSGCSAPPDLTGFAVNTPKTYSENKVFFTRKPAKGEFPGDPSSIRVLQHLYEVHDQIQSENPNQVGRLIRHSDPISIILQGVRIPEDIGTGTRDIAVVLDLQTSSDRGIIQMVAMYQRDVPPGQMLNFNNLLVYADPAWDPVNPPYFRVRVLDVKAERNRRTSKILDEVANVSAEIGGMVPHPMMPIVTTAVNAATMVLGNQENKMILDYQVQFYGEEHLLNAGEATLGAFRTGEWLVIGRPRGESSVFWDSKLIVNRKTNRLHRHSALAQARNCSDSDQCPSESHVPVPYVAVTVVRADAQVPKLVMDRSEQLVSLLSTPAGKSDVDALSDALTDVVSATSMFVRERRLRKYRSVEDLKGIVLDLKKDYENPSLNINEQRRLMYIVNSITDQSFVDAKSLSDWWNPLNLDEWHIVPSSESPLGIRFEKKKPANPGSSQ